MTRYQKISLLIALMIALLLCAIAKAQTFKIESVSGYGYKKDTKIRGAIYVYDSSIWIITTHETTSFKIKRKFDVANVDYYELETMAARTFLWVRPLSCKGLDCGFITLSMRFQKKPERITRYRYKK
jgi:hypothetical protein